MSEDIENHILAPATGTIMDIIVESGRTVEAGDLLGIAESCKMFIDISAPVGGKVNWIADRAQSVAEGEILGWIS